MTGAAFVGLDLGTSGLKSVAVDEGGTVLVRAQAGYATSRPASGAAEQDPLDWQAAVIACLRELTASLARTDHRVRSIGLSAMLPTLVMADADGRALGPALTWQDARAEVIGERLREASGPLEMYRRTGQWLDGRYLLPMFLRVRATDPARAAATRHLLGAKDWLMHWLSGAFVTDPSTATGFGCYLLSEGTWAQDVLEIAAGTGDDPHAARLPPLPQLMPSHTALPLRSELAAALDLDADVSVCVGGADSVLGALGLGAVRPGSSAYVAGTSTVVLGVTDSWTPDPQHRYLVTPMAGADGWGLEMDLLATGSAIRWLSTLLGMADEAVLLRAAAGLAPGEGAAVLPYLAPGEQGALWDTRLRGAFSGLTLADGPAELGRGLIDSILLESRRCLDVLGECGIDGDLHVAGRASADPDFISGLADACGRVVHTPGDRHTDHSALGAALLAAGSAGHGMSAARTVRTCHPRPERAAVWAGLARDHDELRQSLHPTSPTATQYGELT